MTEKLNTGPSVRIYLDTRRIKKNGKYPLKVSVFTSSPTRKQKLYPTRFEFTQDEFDRIWNTERPRGENKARRTELRALETKIQDVCSEVAPFTFEGLERALNRKPGEAVKVAFQYDRKMKELTRSGQVKSKQSYQSSANSLREFLQSRRMRFEDLTFHEIDDKWLTDYENYMTKTTGRSITTVGIYLRGLRALFKVAISEGEIHKEFYPFGEKQYQIPTAQNVKKALSQDQLQRFFNAEPENEFQRKAKDFWFFSYVCNGMNVKDIAKLKYKYVDDETIRFVREKTKRSTKTNQKPIVVYLNSFSRSIIERYGKQEIRSSDYVFDILIGNESPEDEVRKTQNFTRFINQHVKKLAIANGLPGEISTYWARHSFATSVVRKGASMEFIQESLGHKNIKTTQNYFAGFENDAKKEIAESLLNFDS